MKWLIAVLAFAGFFGSAHADDPAEIWMEGFLHLQSALRAEDENDRLAAVRSLTRSLDCSRILANHFRDFEPTRRDQRILLIADKLESMGASPCISYLPSTPSTETLPKVAQSTNPTELEILRSRLPNIWDVRTNPTGSHLNIPLVETIETRRYSEFFNRVDAISGTWVQFLATTE